MSDKIFPLNDMQGLFSEKQVTKKFHAVISGVLSTTAAQGGCFNCRPF